MNRGTLFITTLVALAPSLALSALSGCSSASATGSPPNTPAGAATAGGEHAVTADSRAFLPPPDPSRSTTVILDEPYRYTLRVELARVRGTPLEREVRRLMEAIPQWRPVLDSTDLDPINEIDSIIAASPGKGSKAYMMLARHTASVERVRGFVVAIAEARGETLEWEDHHGIPVADWPGEAEVEQSVAIARPNWLVLGPSAEVARFVAMAQAGDTEIVPGFPMPWEGDGLVVEPDVGLMGDSRGLAVGAERRPHQPREFTFRMSNDAAGNVTARWHGTYDDAAENAAAAEFWDGQRSDYASNAMLSLLGLSSALEEARFEVADTSLDFSLSLTLLQMSRLIRFMTPMIVGGRRGTRGERQDEQSPEAASPPN